MEFTVTVTHRNGEVKKDTFASQSQAAAFVQHMMQNQADSLRSVYISIKLLNEW